MSEEMGGGTVGDEPIEFLEIRADVVDAPVPLWRRIVIPSHVDLERFSDILVRLFLAEEEYCDTYFFSRDGMAWRSSWDEDRDTDPGRTLLGDVLRAPGDSCSYVGDWGATWEMSIELERYRKIPELRAGRTVILSGEGRSPTVMVGSVDSFARHLEYLRDPSHPEHDEAVALLGRGYDAAAFDRKAAQVLVNEITISTVRPGLFSHDVIDLIESHGLHDPYGELVSWAAEWLWDYEWTDPTGFASENDARLLAASALWAANVDSRHGGRLHPELDVVRLAGHWEVEVDELEACVKRMRVATGRDQDRMMDSSTPT